MMTPTIQSGPTTTVRRFFDAWATGDVSGLDELIDAEIVLGPIAGLLYAQEIYVGRSGVEDAFREVATRWDSFEISVEETKATDGEVLAGLRLLVAKRGMSTEMRIPVVCRLRDGRIRVVIDAD